MGLTDGCVLPRSQEGLYPDRWDRQARYADAFSLAALSSALARSCITTHSPAELRCADRTLAFPSFQSVESRPPPLPFCIFDLTRKCAQHPTSAQLSSFSHKLASSIYTTLSVMAAYSNLPPFSIPLSDHSWIDCTPQVSPGSDNLHPATQCSQPTPRRPRDQC